MRSLPGSSKIKKGQEVSHEHVNPEIQISSQTSLAEAVKETAIILAAEANLDKYGSRQFKRGELSLKVSQRDQTEDG